MSALSSLFKTACAVALLWNVAAFAEDWPPVLDEKNPNTKSWDGRVIERYTHGARESWGYPAGIEKEWEYPDPLGTGAAGQNHNSFYLASPKNPRPGAPMCVVLHSANRTAYDYMGFEQLHRKIGGGDDPATVATRSTDEFYALYLSSTNAEWYGWTARRKDPKFKNAPTPAEKRILDTIDWVADRYKIDRNRIYLCGVSMGGCGTLALGMPHGDVFAAIRATVPAGTEYVASSVGGFPPAPGPDASKADRDAWLKTISGVGLPVPPVVVDFSAQNDGWSKTQPALLQAAQAGRLPLVLGWGLFGHATFTSLIAKFPLCEVALEFPWLEVRKNEAYPVFTNASSNQKPPWSGVPAKFDESGQLNAYFRWKSQTDTASRIAMQLWLAHPNIEKLSALPEVRRRISRFAACNISKLNLVALILGN